MYIPLILLITTGVATCGPKKDREIKQIPEYVGEIADPELTVIVNEYKKLAKARGIEFKRDVTIGYSKISGKSVIGTCTYGGKWREIDIDTDFWADASWMSKTILGFHELTHCYCTRFHDYGPDQEYGDGFLASSKPWSFPILLPVNTWMDTLMTDALLRSCIQRLWTTRAQKNTISIM